MFIKNYLIFGTIKKVISNVVTAVIKVFTFLHLGLMLLVADIGAILYFTGVFDRAPLVQTIFFILLAASFIYAVFCWFAPKKRKNYRDDEQRK